MTDNVTVTKVINQVQVGADGPQGPQGPTGATGATGAQGPSGVISVTAPITNSGTSTSAVIGINAGVANGVATLDSGGKVPQSQIPAVAITNTFVVNSQAAMLALTAEEGDVAVRTDLNKTYILAATPASTLGNWQELLTPTDAVSSVDGRVGTVTLSDLYAAKTHASTHASGGTDAVTLAQSQVTNLTTDLAAKAPIASPTFTGSLTTPNAIVTGSTIPANGMYLPSANTLGLATNSTLWLQIDSTGNFGIGSAPVAGQSFRANKVITGSVSGYGISAIGTIQSDVTSSVQLISTLGRTAAASFTLNNLYHFYATQGTIGAGSTVVSQYGYIAESSLIGATNNYGFYGNMAAATGRWNVYMAGNAANYFAGQTTVGSTSLTLGSSGEAQQFGIVSSAATRIVHVVRGASAQTANLTQWQDSSGGLLAAVTSVGGMVGATLSTFNFNINISENSNGGRIRFKKMTAATGSPGADFAQVYFRDGTNAGTLKLVVRAGAAGAETTVLDNIPQ